MTSEKLFLKYGFLISPKTLYGEIDPGEMIDYWKNVNPTIEELLQLNEMFAEEGMFEHCAKIINHAEEICMDINLSDLL